MATTLALDIGATKMAWGFIDDSRPTEATHTGRIPSQPAGSDAAGQLAVALRQAVEGSGIHPDRVGIGAPGVVDPAACRVTHAGDTMPGWAGTDLRAIVHSALGDVPCAVHNDVRVWAYGELTVGAARELQRGRVLFLALGTGLGGAVSQDGALVDGPAGTAGEFSELLCADYRGMAERAENTMSGNGLASYYAAALEAAARGEDCRGRIPWRERGELPVTLEEIVARMGAGDELARRVIAGNAYGLGRAVAGVVSGFDLRAVVLGGGVLGIGDAVVDPLRAGVADHVLRPNREVPVLVTQSPAHAPLLGAAAYARDHAR